MKGGGHLIVGPPLTQATNEGSTEMDETERFNHVWGKAYDSGYHSGYMDAIGELWTLERRAFDAGDVTGANLIGDVINQVREREAAVIERNKQLLAEAAAKQS